MFKDIFLKYKIIIILPLILSIKVEALDCRSLLKKVRTLSFTKPETTSPREDFYLTHVQLQPKMTIAQYVGKYVLVPRIFPTFEKALASGKPFIIRSEHPLEYSEAAGLFDSIKVDQEMIQTAQKNMSRNPKAVEPGMNYVLPWIYLGQKLGHRVTTEGMLQNFAGLSMKKSGEEYANLAGLDSKEFESKISYSFWELLGGYNRSIIADSAIKGRYHIITTVSRADSETNYSVVENGKVIFSLPDNLPSDLKRDLPKTVDFYETIRNLPNFNPQHCPLIEFQTYKNKNYFLQYHRSRDFEPPTFTLTREPEPDEIVAENVRGVTGPEGLTLKVDIIGNHSEQTPDNPVALLEAFYEDKVYGEFMSRKIQLQMINRDRNNLAVKLDGHTSKSRLFNPPLSLVFPLSRLSLFKPIHNVNSFKIHVISDGSKAYIKFLEIDKRQ